MLLGLKYAIIFFMRKIFKKLWKILTNKVFLTALFLLIQIAFIAVVIVYLSFTSIGIYILFSVFSLIVCLIIISRDDNPAFKLAWVVPIMALPFFGGFLYMFLGRRRMSAKKRKRMLNLDAAAQKEMAAMVNCAEGLGDDQKKLAAYVKHSSGYPVFNDTQTFYYDSGEKYFAALADELEKAQKFIFMEYFIIERGIFWNSVLEILERKVKDGVEVRVMYDDVGCLFTLPAGYDLKLKRKGIQTSVFNKITPSIDARMNNRTHRKIAVIDGKTAFTGGINIADEYINEKMRFGHWKDTGMMFKGGAVDSFTLMFLSFWAMAEKEKSFDFSAYRADRKYLQSVKASGKVQPLAGGPGANVQLIENAFIQIINNADKYVYINTPYLILDNEIYTALRLAAKSGIDVRITMPHIPDKKMVFMMSRSFYSGLLKSGVKIYEYVPGFNHAKSFVADDSIAYIGTCNMDYRSFYLHYECGALLYDTDSIADMKQDYLQTLKQCKQISLAEANNVTVFTKIARSVLKVFSPLL